MYSLSSKVITLCHSRIPLSSHQTYKLQLVQTMVRICGYRPHVVQYNVLYILLQMISRHKSYNILLIVQATVVRGRESSIYQMAGFFENGIIIGIKDMPTFWFQLTL